MTPYFQEGGITIYHGDCREILPTLPAADLILADPPYGIKYRHGVAKGPHASSFDLVTCEGDDVPFDPAFLLAHSKKLILWGANNYAQHLASSGGWLIWDKRCNTVVNDMSDAELAWTNLMNTARVFYHVWDGFRRQTEKDVKRVHPMQKPVALITWCLKFAPPHTKTVIDPFCGSGSTLVACKNARLDAIGIEIEERYCEIAASRLNQGVFAFEGAS